MSQLVLKAKEVPGDLSRAGGPARMDDLAQKRNPLSVTPTSW